jgi:alkanesulfonate monooxygenase SsuD/methylene tetrahydromethanopterin reductase-like flavin-dependent oxidoreductase (luciferase family)
VHVGGESDAALRRAVVHGDGWFGMGHRHGALPEVVARLDRVLAEHGRSRESFTLTISPPPDAVDQDTVARYAEHGVDRLIMAAIARNRDELLRSLDALRKQTI